MSEKNEASNTRSDLIYVVLLKLDNPSYTIVIKSSPAQETEKGRILRRTLRSIRTKRYCYDKNWSKIHPHRRPQDAPPPNMVDQSTVFITLENVIDSSLSADSVQ